MGGWFREPVNTLADKLHYQKAPGASSPAADAATASTEPDRVPVES